MWRLLYPLRYFSLVNNEKRSIDLWPSLLLAGLLALPFVALPGTSFFSPNGFLDKLLTLMSCLTGFYVAALVAAATFSHPDLDKTITAGPIALVTKDHDGKRITELLTRREFACTIFGYLAFSTLALSIVAAFLIALTNAKTQALSSGGALGHFFAGNYFLYVRGVIIFGICLVTSHIFMVTCLGLYYLMDRLYRRDRRIVTPKSSADSDAA
jgi:hypothetical protein